jgi:hypothetical protein
MTADLLFEATRIGGRLAASLREDEGGVYWVDATEQESPWLYHGSSGIALFLLELYQQNDDRRLLDVARAALARAVAFAKKNPRHGFFLGSAGLLYVLGRAAEIAGDSVYDAWAAEIGDTLTDLPFESCELFVGPAGTLLGLLHLHQRQPSAKTRASIESLVRLLTDRAFIAPRGLYWERALTQSRGLTGMAHGAAGIGFALFEASHHFGSDACRIVATEAYRYEQSHYDATLRNWADFRIGAYLSMSRPDALAHLKEQCRAGNLAPFTSRSFVTAWCHGAAGVGLTRVRAYEITGHEEFLQQARDAAATTLAAQAYQIESGGPAVLCHGLMGNALLFVELARHDSAWLEHARTAARAAVGQYATRGHYLSGIGETREQEDPSVMLGIAGIGSAYLSLRGALLGHPTRTVLAAAVEGRSRDSLQWRESDVHDTIVDKHYRRTRTLLGHSAKALEPFEQQMAGVARPQLADVFALERQRADLDRATVSQGLVFIKDMVAEEDGPALLALDSEALLQRELFLDADVTLCETRWDWSSFDPRAWLRNLQEPPSAAHQFLRVAVRGIEEGPLSPFAYELLRQFSEGRVVADAVRAIAEQVEDEEESAVRDVTLDQIRLAIRAHLLLPRRGIASTG